MLTIVIVSYNSAATLQRCQDELLSSQRFPVIIVDNASRDGSADILQQRYPHLRLIRMARNEGYGRAANRGLAEVATPYAFLLNPDLLATPDSVAAMLQFADQHAEASLVAPAVTADDFLMQGGVDRNWVIGAAMLFRMRDFSTDGFFDENIFLFEEDTDLCWRVKARGHRILLNSDLRMSHLKGQSSGVNPRIEALKNWHRGWSKMYLLHKHGYLSGWWAPRRLWLKYRLKSLITADAAKRSKLAERSAGMRAYLRGEQAFLADGNAQGMPQLAGV